MRAADYVKFLRYLKNYFYFLTQMCIKRIVNMCAKFWENMLTGIRFMDFVLHDLGQSMHK